MTNDNRQILNELYNYAHGIGSLNPQKGLWIFGEIGTGKTTLIKILAEYQRTMGRGFKCVNCSTIASQYASQGIESLDEHTFSDVNQKAFDAKGNQVNEKSVEKAFDELGRETVPARYFGNELNVMQYIFQLRYNLKLKTHATSNLKPDSIIGLYGEHIYDRAIEMFNFIELRGESKRK